MENKNTLWEYVKCQIRTDTLKYAKQRAIILRKNENNLKLKFEEFENNLDDDPLKYSEYLQNKAEWEHLLKRLSNGATIRSKAQ